MREPADPANPQGLFLPPHLLWEAIVDSSDDAIISKDLNGIVQSWNGSAERIFGYTAQEMIGTPILRLIPADRKDEETHILAQLRNGERVDHYETIRVRKDGAPIDVSLTISPIRTSDGKVVGASKIARDITVQKRAAQQLARAHEELKRNDRLKAEFIATLSHELRTPLTAITGWIQILEDDPDATELREGLQVIKRNVRAQSQLIEDLLDMSRIEAGKILLDIQRVDLAATVEAAIDSVRPAADARQIRLTTAFSSVEGVVMGDRNRMQQMLWNLLTNAVKFTPKGGRVHITVERINSHVEIAVADNGIGIAPEFIDHVFERFSQADAGTRRRHSGLGIGLSIVKHLAELHGGSVGARSAGPGEGATFIVSVPLLPVRGHAPQQSSPAAATPDTSSPVDADLAGVNVLAVDDDPDSAEIIRRILERRGARVRVARSAEEAIRLFEEARPDVLLSDIGMPDQDGYELIQQIRGLPAASTVPAVALTALARSEDRTRALRAGFQMHVAKPVDAEELVAVVRNLAALRPHE